MSGEMDAPMVRLELASRPEAARLVRSMASAAGEALGFDPELLNDVNTALTEACNNVILHAYGGTPGPMSVELEVTPEGVEVGVCDLGCGIRQALPEQDGLKVGLALMSALADRAEFINIPDGGTQVRMSFRDAGLGQRWAHAAPSDSVDMDRALAWRTVGPPELSGEVILTVSPVTLLGPVLGRIGRTLAPSAGFSLARCYDVYLLTDALGVHAERAAQSSSISVALGARDHRLEFAVSPLRLGTSGRLGRAVSAHIRDALARLSDDISVSSLDSHETLRVSMRDHLRA
jgi:anti-sigma regulatory factor (Ser/Thr protein kinase)